METLVLAADGTRGARNIHDTLESEGYTTVVATPDGDSFVVDGEEMDADVAVGEVGNTEDEREYGAVVVADGAAHDTLGDDAVEAVARFAEEGAFVASLGTGIEVLARAGVLDARLVACPTEAEETATDAGATVVDEAVAVDAKLLTARSGKEAARGLAEELHRKLRRARVKGL